MPVAFPSFELQASNSALRHLVDGISGWRIERLGNSVLNVWLKTSDEATWLVEVDQRDLQPMFEVFTLGLVSMDELQQRWDNWNPPVLPKEVPDGFRRLLTTRPARPVAPTRFDPWPLRSWRTDVVRRVEFIIDGADAGPGSGNDPNMRSAARPLAVPACAQASCEVAAGVLFTGGDRQLLLAVDRMAMNMLISQDDTEIGLFLEACELVGMADYVDRRCA